TTTVRSGARIARPVPTEPALIPPPTAAAPQPRRLLPSRPAFPARSCHVLRSDGSADKLPVFLLPTRTNGDVQKLVELLLVRLDGKNVIPVGAHPNSERVRDVQIRRRFLLAALVQVELRIAVRRQLQRGLGENARPRRFDISDNTPAVWQFEHRIERSRVPPLPGEHGALKSHRHWVPLIQEPDIRLDVSGQLRRHFDLLAARQLLRQRVHLGAPLRCPIPLRIWGLFQRRNNRVAPHRAHRVHVLQMVRHILGNRLNPPRFKRFLPEPVADQRRYTVDVLPVERVVVPVPCIDTLQSHATALLRNFRKIPSRSNRFSIDSGLTRKRCAIASIDSPALIRNRSSSVGGSFRPREVATPSGLAAGSSIVSSSHANGGACPSVRAFDATPLSGPGVAHNSS